VFGFVSDESRKYWLRRVTMASKLQTHVDMAPISS
jgi:hypothetical protein